MVIFVKVIETMIDRITKYLRSADRDYTFSIIIPSWNNLPYLKNCMESLALHSSLPHQVIVVVNEGTDGTLEWLKEPVMDHVDLIHSPQNMGICHGVNLGRTLVKAGYIIYMNDDMYVLPGWDTALYAAIRKIGTQMFMLSATMIEPVETGNNCVVVKDYGSDLESFDREKLLHEYKALQKSDWMGSTWPPVVLHRDLWDMVGGFSTEFSPGMYSDPDLSCKLLQTGVRHFLGVGSSLVYHFGSKSTRRIKKNQGRKTFMSKWGISSRVFRKEFLKMGKNYSGPLPEPDQSIRNHPFNRLKRFFQ